MAERSSVEIAEETTYGSLTAGGITPSSGALTFAGMEVRRGFSYDGQEQAAAALDMARAGFFEHAPEVIAPWDTGDAAPYDIRWGNIGGLIVPVRGVGDGTTFTDHDDYYLDLLLRTLYEPSPAVGGFPAQKADAVNGVAISATKFTPTTAANYSIGQMISVLINGRVEYTRVVDVDAITPVITVSPALSKSLAVGDGDTVRLGRTYYLPNSGGTPTGGSVAIRESFDGDVSFTSYGCRLGRHTWRFESGMLYLDVAEMAVGVTIHDAVANTPVNATIPCDTNGRPVDPAQYRPAYTVLSGAMSQTAAAPQTLARNELAVDERAGGWQVEVTPTWRMTGGTDSVLQWPSLELAGYTVRATVNCDLKTGIFADMRRKRERRNLVLGAGPHNEGMGFAAMIPAAFLPDTINPDVSDVKALHRPVFGADRWVGDNSTSAPAGANFCVFLPR